MADRTKDDGRKSSQHGSTWSYVIGFVLSLIFTIIPYYMVRAQTAGDRTLLLAILGFAILQMLVQIFFFLHLGRGPKPLYNVVFFVATAGLIVLVIGASLLIMDNLYRNMSPAEVTTRLAQDENIAQVGNKLTGACQGNGANYVASIKDGQISPGRIEANRCDTLSFTASGVDSVLVFGPHEKHVSYSGLDEISVSSGRSKVITLNQTGDFSFHQESDPKSVGYFTVKP